MDYECFIKSIISRSYKKLPYLHKNAAPIVQDCVLYYINVFQLDHSARLYACKQRLYDSFLRC
jgi:hypothetical protein